jgi:hypothetical protein
MIFNVTVYILSDLCIYCLDQPQHRGITQQKCAVGCTDAQQVTSSRTSGIPDSDHHQGIINNCKMGFIDDTNVDVYCIRSFITTFG